MHGRLSRQDKSDLCVVAEKPEVRLGGSLALPTRSTKTGFWRLEG